MALHPELNGQRLKLPNDPAVYLIDQGKRRWVPDPGTYNNLFSLPILQGVGTDYNLLDIDLGTQITHDAVLAQPVGGAAVYLIDNGVKRQINSPDIMTKYNFDWNKIQQCPHIVLDFVPSGSTISS